MLPDGWKIKSLDDITIVERGKFTPRPRNDPRYYNGHMPFIQTGDVASAKTYLKNYTQTLNQKGINVSKVFPINTILITIAANIGETTITTFKIACPDSVVGIISKIDITNVFWLKMMLETKKEKLNSLATQNAQKNINLQILKPLLFLIPPLPEQQKIAQILSTWDKAIEKLEALIAAKQKRKKALMQQLLTGKKRFSGFVKSNNKLQTKYGTIPTEWGYIPIEKIAKQISIKNNGGENLQVLSCTKHYGLVDSLSYFGKQIFSQDTSTYKIVPRNSFAYATNHIEEGSIGYQNICNIALISPMYTVFQTESNINDDFLYRLLKTELYRHIFEANTNASVDRRGSLRWNQFSQIKIPIPSLSEQQKIASVLSTADKEIKTHQKQLDAFKQQKKGLMQQLLTGKKRVKPDNGKPHV